MSAEGKGTLRNEAKKQLPFLLKEKAVIHEKEMLALPASAIDPLLACSFR